MRRKWRHTHVNLQPRAQNRTETVTQHGALEDGGSQSQYSQQSQGGESKGSQSSQGSHSTARSPRRGRHNRRAAQQFMDRLRFELLLGHSGGLTRDPPHRPSQRRRRHGERRRRDARSHNRARTERAAIRGRPPDRAVPPSSAQFSPVLASRAGLWWVVASSWQCVRVLASA